jgi:uncharacterized protein YndB with AHSA1/START domain
MNTTSDIRGTQPQGAAGVPDRIEKKVLLRAPRSKVWRVLTDIDEFRNWFGVSESEGSFAPGARLRMVPIEEYGCGEFYVFVEQMDKERLFSWRWHPGALDPKANYAAEPTTLVVFQLEDAPGGTMLTITESGFRHISLARRAAVFGENSQGWDFQAASLEKYVAQAS